MPSPTGMPGGIVRLGIKPGQWGWSFDELAASWRVADEAGFDVVSCFDHVTASPRPLAAWDAPTLLTAMAALTSRPRLGVHVINLALRHPYLLAAQLAVAQALSGGRLEVGLGAGSHHLARIDHLALGVRWPPHAERLERLEACCRSLPALWRGESVTDPHLELRGVSLGSLGIDAPPIVVGGAGDRVLDIAARLAQGWSAPSLEPSEFAERCALLDRACERAGRDKPIEKQAQRFVDGMSPSQIRDLIHRYRDAGADCLILVLHTDRGPDAVRRAAEALW